MSTAMIAITTSSSMSVNALRARSRVRTMTRYLVREKGSVSGHGEPARLTATQDPTAVAVGGRVGRRGKMRPHPAHPTGVRHSPRAHPETGDAAAGRASVWRFAFRRRIGKDR